MIDVTVGDIIPLNLQLHDGNENVNVTAVLIDRYGTEVFRVNLRPISRGLFLNLETPMPGPDILIAQYFTDKPDLYEIAQDIFNGVEEIEEPESPILGEVVGVEMSDTITGEVING